jgi:hypothetical protein
MRAIGAAVLLVSLVLMGCSSTSIVVRELDKAIIDVQQANIRAICRGARLETNTSQVELSAQTAFNVTLGAPAGSIPIAVSGTGGLQQSTRVTVHLSHPSTLKPTDSACKELLATPTTGFSRHYDIAGQKVEEVPVESKVLVYDTKSGTVEEVEINKMRK